MKLHRDLGITQKSVWFMLHRIRKAMESESDLFVGPVEVDETCLGGLEKNKHASKKLNAGCGTVGETAIIGAKDCATGQVNAEAMEDTTVLTLQGFVCDSAHKGA